MCYRITNYHYSIHQVHIFSQSPSAEIIANHKRMYGDFLILSEANFGKKLMFQYFFFWSLKENRIFEYFAKYVIKNEKVGKISILKICRKTGP